MVHYEIKVTGRVQGVGFRYFVLKRAVELSITGWVKNTNDGGVLVMAQGDSADIETFLDYLALGPALARVTHITKTPMPSLENYREFRVRH